ncbi:50S ribosomal protein L4 [Mycena floridula]|nr:50S ribosomal protein L4 [Mycena floridula]
MLHNSNVFRTVARSISTSASRLARVSPKNVGQAKSHRLHRARPTVKAVPISQPLYMNLSSTFRTVKGDPSTKDVVVLHPSVFNHPIRRDILHLCVIHHLDSLRQGSASTKTRGEVKGSGRKLYRQKGTGKARVGDGQSPTRRGGGVAFGPKPRDFSTSLPRKVIQMGMRVALSVKTKEQTLGVVTRLDWPNGRTKFLAQRLRGLGLSHTLFITGEPDVGLTRAMRNIRSVKLISSQEVNVYELMRWPRLVLDTKAVEFFERTLAKNVPLAPIPIAS